MGRVTESAMVSDFPVTGELIVHIGALLPSLAPAEQRVARQILASPAGAAQQTITHLAAAAKTSEATVIRFCRSVGVDGYPQLRLRLARESARREAPDGRTVGSEIPAGASMAEIISVLAHHEARSIEETAEQLDAETCERVVAALHGASRIDVYGAGASGFIAGHFQQRLHHIGRAAYYWPDVHLALGSAALLGPGDVVVGISHAGTNADVLDVLAVARERGATTVALTNFPRSPISRVADCVLTTAVRETTYRAGETASRAALLTVIDCLFVGVSQRDQDRSRAALRSTSDAVRGRRVRR
jgi:DNA-binding MurR/RpiR family transcriptional regulator